MILILLENSYESFECIIKLLWILHLTLANDETKGSRIK